MVLATKTMRSQGLLFLEMLPAEWKERAKDFFTYSVSFVPIVAGGNATAAFNTQNDSSFVMVGLVATARGIGAGQPVITDRALLVQLTDSGSGRNLQDSPADFENLFGTAQLPSFLPAPKFLKPSTTFTVELTSLLAADANVRINFLGFKVFNTDMGQVGV